MPASAPLLSLKNVSLGFGGPPLLAGVELTVGEGERLALVGRNGSGKSTLLKIVAGLVEPDRGERIVARARRSAICRRSRTSPASRPSLAYVEAGLAPGDDPYRAQVSARRARLHRERGAGATFRRRGAARGAGARAGARAPTC